MRRLEYIEENEHTMNKGNLPQGEDPKESLTIPWTRSTPSTPTMRCLRRVSKKCIRPEEEMGEAGK